MKTSMSLSRAARAAALSLSLAAGCSQGQNSDIALVPAKGKVTLDSKPLPGVVVEFIPAGETRGLGGSGRTDAEGAYSVTTTTGQPGLAAGSYEVVITKRQVSDDPSAPPPPPPDPGDTSLPPEYSNRLKTTLKAAVATGPVATNDFDLKTRKRR